MKIFFRIWTSALLATMMASIYMVWAYGEGTLGIKIVGTIFFVVMIALMTFALVADAIEQINYKKLKVLREIEWLMFGYGIENIEEVHRRIVIAKGVIQHSNSLVEYLLESHKKYCTKHRAKQRLADRHWIEKDMLDCINNHYKGEEMDGN